MSKLRFYAFLSCLLTFALSSPCFAMTEGDPNIACVTAMIAGEPASTELTTSSEAHENNKLLVLRTLTIEYPVLFSKKFLDIVLKYLKENKIDPTLFRGREELIASDFKFIETIFKNLKTEYSAKKTTKTMPLSESLQITQENLARAKSLGLDLPELEAIAGELDAINNNAALKSATYEVLRQKLPQYFSVLNSTAQSRMAITKITEPYSSKSNILRRVKKLFVVEAAGAGLGAGAWFLTQSDLVIPIFLSSPLIYESARATYGLGQAQFYKGKAAYQNWRFRKNLENLPASQASEQPLSTLLGKLTPPEMKVIKTHDLSDLTPSLDLNNLEEVISFGGPISHFVGVKTREYGALADLISEGVSGYTIKDLVQQLRNRLSATSSVEKSEVYDALFNAIANHQKFLIENISRFSALEKEVKVASEKLPLFLKYGATTWEDFRTTPEGSDQSLTRGFHPGWNLPPRLSHLAESETVAKNLVGLLQVAQQSMASKITLCEKRKTFLAGAIQNRTARQFTSQEITHLIEDLEKLVVNFE